MNVTRFAAAPEYTPPPNHSGMRCLRLQGHAAGPASALWLGCSMIEPGGAIALGASPLEKHYVVLEGEVVFRTGAQEAALGRWDSVRLAPGEARSVENRTDAPAVILLAMPLLAMPLLAMPLPT